MVVTGGGGAEREREREGERSPCVYIMPDSIMYL